MEGDELYQANRHDPKYRRRCSASFTLGCYLHDIGKVGIPDSILLKPGPLTKEEHAIMMLHPQIAHHILAPLGLPVAATEQEIPGNGIRLYIIKSIVEKLGGKN